MATAEQLADHPQPGQVSLRVPADPARTPRRWQELALLVVAQRAYRDPGRAGEFPDAVLARDRHVVAAVRVRARRTIRRIHLRQHRLRRQRYDRLMAAVFGTLVKATITILNGCAVWRRQAQRDLRAGLRG